MDSELIAVVNKLQDTFASLGKRASYAEFANVGHISLLFRRGARYASVGCGGSSVSRIIEVG